MLSIFFFFNDTATTEIYTLSLHDALPISGGQATAPKDARVLAEVKSAPLTELVSDTMELSDDRSEEHTSELQSQSNLVCRLLLEKKKKKIIQSYPDYSHSCDVAVQLSAHT